MSIEIRRATSDDVDIVAPLFDTYRVFYGKPADLLQAHTSPPLNSSARSMSKAKSHAPAGHAFTVP